MAGNLSVPHVFDEILEPTFLEGMLAISFHIILTGIVTILVRTSSKIPPNYFCYDGVLGSGVTEPNPQKHPCICFIEHFMMILDIAPAFSKMRSLLRMWSTSNIRDDLKKKCGQYSESRCGCGLHTIIFPQPMLQHREVPYCPVQHADVKHSNHMENPLMLNDI